MEKVEFIFQINIAIIAIASLCVLWAVIASLNDRGRNFRSSRNRRARKQF
ncbi:hypothetical protein [Pareuzebyella sediminis]|nr:hypothetical protein [Pareuzebyella sediminis]